VRHAVGLQHVGHTLRAQHLPVMSQHHDVNASL
jgi:hypothetical protein